MFDAKLRALSRVRVHASHVGAIAPGCCASAAGEGSSEPRPELVPFGFDNPLLSTGWAESHVQWMVQKDELQQDMYLLGVHSPLRRWLVFRFCEVAGREVSSAAL